MLSRAKRNPRHEVSAEAVLETIQNLLAAVAHDFIQPGAAIDSDKERAFVEAGGLGVSGDGWVDRVIPDSHDFRFGPAAIHSKVRQDFRHHVLDAAGRSLTHFFLGG